tara:strand:- start:6868 stop:7326 length:459 start_codon:yes stop_codon:yes gene_type:complete
MKNYQEILKKVELIINTKQSIETKLKFISSHLESRIEKYHWVGFYISDNKKKQLTLGPYSGKETPHKVIPFGRGVCGRVANDKKSLLINDVKKEKNYILCNMDVKSEIVYPIIKNGIVIGEIDIDSNYINAFNHEDEFLLMKICDQLVNHMT